jgi:hypothetical protein
MTADCAWHNAARWLRTLRLMGQDIQELQPELFQLGGLEVGCGAF